MRKFIVNVNGTSYEVEVEEIGGAQSAPVTQVAPAVNTAVPVATLTAVPAPAAPATPAPATQAAPVAVAPAGSTQIKAPMPGTILKIVATAGAQIKKGEVLLILEAMKMENEIMSPTDGTIASIHVVQGASVDTGNLLVSIN